MPATAATRVARDGAHVSDNVRSVPRSRLTKWISTVVCRRDDGVEERCAKVTAFAVFAVLATCSALSSVVFRAVGVPRHGLTGAVAAAVYGGLLLVLAAHSAPRTGVLDNVALATAVAVAALVHFAHDGVCATGSVLTCAVYACPFVPLAMLHDRVTALQWFLATASLLMTVKAVPDRAAPLTALPLRPLLYALVVVVMWMAAYVLAHVQRAVRADVRHHYAAAGQRALIAEERATVALEQSATKTRFVSVMSHEIRNPLTAVLLDTELLATTQLTAQQADFVQGISTAATLLLAVVNEILDVNKIESGTVRLSDAPFDVRSTCEQVLQTLAAKAGAKQVELVLMMEPAISGSATGCAVRFRQILLNVVDNGLKFTATGQVVVTVADDGPVGTCDDGRRRRRWRVDVTDSGVGISPAGQAALFREFSQVDQSTTREHGGTGLGLFICRELCRLMGGDIHVASELGAGATFSYSVVLGEDSVRECVERLDVSDEWEWRVLIVEANRFVASVLRDYAAYLLHLDAAAITVLAHTSDAIRAAERLRRPRAATTAAATKSPRVLALVDAALATSTLDSVLIGRADVVPCIASWNSSAQLHEEFAARQWQGFIVKPVLLQQMRSVLASCVQREAPAPLASTLARRR